MMSTEKGVSAFPDGENLFKWIGTITGPRDTVITFITYYTYLSNATNIIAKFHLQKLGFKIYKNVEDFEQKNKTKLIGI